MRELKFYSQVIISSLFIMFSTVSAWGFADELAGRAHLKFVNLDKKSETAMIYITIFQNQSEWDNENGLTLGAVTGAQKEVVVENLHSQCYAFSAFVDLNGNGKLDTNFLGVPQEPWALSKIGSKLPLGKPPWSAIALELNKGGMIEAPLYFHY